MSKLGKYIKTHGKAFALKRKSGKGVVQIKFYDGYVTIETRQPGTPKFINEIHIPRSAWHTLVMSPQLRELTKMMEGPDFDRYAAEREYYKEEALMLQELREGKREARKTRQDQLRAKRVRKLRAQREQS